MKNIFRTFIVSLTLSLLIISCGGGGGGSTNQTSTVSEEQVSAALTELTPKLESLMSQPTLTSADVSQALASVSDVRVLGTSTDGSVLAEIGENGPRIVVASVIPPYATYDPASDPINQPYLGKPAISGQTAQTDGNRLKLNAANTSVPLGPRVLLMSSLNSAAFKNPTQSIKDIFLKEDRGYTSGDITVLDGTIDNLKLVKNYDTFFFKGHGLLSANKTTINPNVPDIYAYTLTSSTRVNLANPFPSQYILDILKTNIVFAYVPTDNAIANTNCQISDCGKKKWEWLYGITTGFVIEYWSFNPGSFVMINACSSASNEAGNFYSTLLDAQNGKNVGTYLGWSTYIDSDFADERAKFVFDRLLGANSLQPALDPPQRPFDIKALETEMINRNLVTWPGISGVKAWLNNVYYAPSTLKFAYNPDKIFGLLAPSIKKLEVDEKAMRLTIYGIFGVQNGRSLKVTINGEELPWKDWKEDQIVTELLPEKSGDVIVEINGRKSNPVKLTEWHIKFTYDEETVLQGAGSVTKKMTFDVRFRADVHGYRDSSGVADPTLPDNIPFFAESSSFVTYSGQGTLNLGAITDPYTITLGGGGTITTLVRLSQEAPPVTGDYFDCEGYIDAKNKRLVIYLHGDGYNLTWSDGGTDSVEYDTDTLSIKYGSAEYLPYGTAFKIPLDANFGIQAGTPTDAGYGVTMSLSWSTTPAVAPPATNDVR